MDAINPLAGSSLSPLAARRPCLVARFAALGLSLTLAASAAHAGGFYLPAHGVRGLGRAGAFVAGGGDPSVIWYNPANIAGLEGKQFLFDVAIAIYDASYTRVDSGGNPRPTVKNEGDILPVPTLAFTMPLIADRLFLGASITAPMASLPAYPQPSYGPCASPDQQTGCAGTADNDAPQRYSLISYKGTLLLQLDVALAYRVLPELTVGVSMQNLFASLFVLKALSSYNGVLSSGPEDPDFDTLTQLKVVDLFNPSAKIGVTYQPNKHLRLGFSLQLPFWIDAEGEVDVQLPRSVVYSKSSVEGSAAQIRFMFPLKVGVGVELTPTERLRVELDFQWENWSGTSRDCPDAALGASGGASGPRLQCEIIITPKDVYILNIPGIPRYKIPGLAERLGFRDSFSVRLGAELDLGRLTLRGGYGFEFGAVPIESRSVIASDDTKHMLAVGASFRIAWARLDVAYALVLTPGANVHYKSSEARQLNPINPIDAAAVGGGAYRATSHVLGVGMQKTF